MVIEQNSHSPFHFFPEYRCSVAAPIRGPLEESSLLWREVVPVSSTLPFACTYMGLDHLAVGIRLYQTRSEPDHNLLPCIPIWGSVTTAAGVEITVTSHSCRAPDCYFIRLVW